MVLTATIKEYNSTMLHKVWEVSPMLLHATKAVYIAPQTDAGTKTSLNELYTAISKQENAHPEAVLLVAGASYYPGSDVRRMWQGLQTITDYKEKHSQELPSDTSLPDEVNNFYARFEASNTEACMSASAVPDNCVITLSAADVSKTFKQVSIHKAAGPDALPGRVLRACADQLASVFTDIFNIPMSESVIPTCFKQTTIVPVPRTLR